MLKIAVDGGNHILGQTVKSGIERLVEETCIYLKMNKNIKLSYYSFPPFPKFGFSKIILPLSVMQEKNDVFIGFSGYIPKLLTYSKIKKIVCIHDLAFLENPSYFPSHTKLAKQTEKSLRRADYIIVFSNYIKKKILSTYHFLNKNCIVVIYPGSDHLSSVSYTEVDSYLFNPDATRELALPLSYFLLVGVVKPMKQIHKVLAIFDKYITLSNDVKTVLLCIGKKEEEYYRRILKSDVYQKLKDRVFFLDMIDDSHLSWYLQHARALLNYSAEEGFCYPVIEALHMKTKCIVNNLDLYKEYAKYSKQLVITSNENEFIMEMMSADHNSQSTEIPFTWKKFTSALLKIL